MIRKIIHPETGEKCLEVDTVEDFDKALNSGLPVLASQAIREQYGVPDENDAVETRDEVIDAA